MEVLVCYQKILNHFEKVENNEYLSLFSKYYVRYEFDNFNLTDVEKKMSTHEICFSTKINKEEDIRILMHIFEHLMYIMDILQRFKSGNYDNTHFFFNYMPMVFLNPDFLDSLIFNVIRSKKVEPIDIFHKYGIYEKNVGKKSYYERKEDRDKLLNMFIYGSKKELNCIFYENNFYDDFSEIKHRHIKKEIKNNRIKIYHIHHLLKLIDKIKIFVWKNDLINTIFKNNDESLYRNMYYFVPNDVIDKKKLLLHELIKEAWHPDRFMDWCL